MPRRLVKHEELDTACDLPVTVVNLFRMGLVCGVLAVYIPTPCPPRWEMETLPNFSPVPARIHYGCHPLGIAMLYISDLILLGLNPHLLSACFGALASAAVFDAPCDDYPGVQCLKLGMCFAVGLLPYIYLPFLQGEMSWPTASMLRHILRGDYGTLSLGSATNPHANDDRVTPIAVVGAFVEDTGILSLCLGILMSVVALRCETNVRIITLVCVTSFLIYMTVFSWMANLSLESSLLRNSVYPRFWVQPLLPLHLITGVGLATLWGDMPAYAMKYLLGCTADRSDVRTVSEAELSSRNWWESSQRRHILPGLSHLPVPNNTENLKILMTHALRENRPLFFVHLPSFMSAGYAPDYFGTDKLMQGLALYPTGSAIRVHGLELRYMPVRQRRRRGKHYEMIRESSAQSGSIFEGHELREGTFEAALFARQCTQFEYGMAALLQFDATAKDYAALAEDAEYWIAQCDDASLLDPHTGLATASLRVSPESWRAIGWIFSRLPQGERKAALYLKRYLQSVNELDVGNPEIERIRDYVAAVQRLISDESNTSV
ncbi:hypothetical protein FOZ60_013083 [Perkinsus olseni]|uniref:Uncharacterized protein n=1 Tax=Perkinsus olseni TaxID=32597 RepID=A0A7J6P975_PEROL|nr:hypothetical protein FOZ60_013083 [Perkinsus olseni]